MASSKGTFQPDSDVHITYDDQLKINKFAKLNAKLEDLKEEIKTRVNDMKDIEEALEEVTLADDEEKYPYLVGEVFMYLDVAATETSLKDAEKVVKDEIDGLKLESSKIKDTMADLKAHLYGKFGSHINLEADE